MLSTTGPSTFGAKHFQGPVVNTPWNWFVLIKAHQEMERGIENAWRKGTHIRKIRRNPILTDRSLNRPIIVNVDRYGSQGRQTGAEGGKPQWCLGGAACGTTAFERAQDQHWRASELPASTHRSPASKASGRSMQSTKSSIYSSCSTMLKQAGVMREELSSLDRRMRKLGRPKTHQSHRRCSKTPLQAHDTSSQRRIRNHSSNCGLRNCGSRRLERQQCGNPTSHTAPLKSMAPSVDRPKQFGPLMMETAIGGRVEVSIALQYACVLLSYETGYASSRPARF